MQLGLCLPLDWSSPWNIVHGLHLQVSGTTNHKILGQNVWCVLVPSAYNISKRHFWRINKTGWKWDRMTWLISFLHHNAVLLRNEKRCRWRDANLRADLKAEKIQRGNCKYRSDAKYRTKAAYTHKLGRQNNFGQKPVEPTLSYQLIINKKNEKKNKNNFLTG